MSFNNPVVGGENGELIRAAIQSPNYVPNVSGWTINRDGSAEFNNVTIRFDLATGSIVVGPASGPQVVIFSDGTSGLVEFPTNAPGEIDPASIRSQSVGTGANENEELTIKSAETINNVYSRIVLDSGDVDGAPEPTVLIGLVGVSGSQTFNLGSGSIQLGDVLVLNNGSETDEILVGSIGFRDGNYPMRIARGIRGTGTTDTAVAGTDTLITNAASTTAYLMTDVAYRIDVQIIQRATAGTAAAGTQQVAWKLWDGAVGGTQLGTTITKTNDNVGMAQGPYQFSFLFRHTGSTGTRTINLSAAHTVGADTIQARVNATYFMLVNRIGDRNVITNL